MLRPDPQRTVEYKLSHGINLLVGGRSEDRTALLTVKEIFGDHLYEIALESEPLTIVDLGANIGIYSLYSAVHYKNAMIYSVEPDETNFARFRDNIAHNSFEKRILPLQVAISPIPGEISFYHHPDSSRGHSLVRKSEDAAKVKGITLSQLFDHFRIKRCDILKMDIEGAEYDVLLRCSTELLNRIKAIVLEYHDYFPSDPERNPSRLKQFLAEQGFKIFRDHGSVLCAMSN